MKFLTIYYLIIFLIDLIHKIFYKQISGVELLGELFFYIPLIYLLLN